MFEANVAMKLATPKSRVDWRVGGGGDEEWVGDGIIEI